ncbi:MULTISPECIES: hypothetical protein [Streptomyces]|uniref:Uncharacterized protein n=2 Tax=Streptomyces rimosus subsp. rimosus TaxID=132474 RepID=L8EYX1_STRR1|nr:MULTISPECIES: hypothetical protein [Streptomyces]KOG70562.1 hypothetical protein ADK78_28680 [Kitasatospora aureofaciens]MYT47347.1 hypothetical protein [Streptomyces sp. SID5471]KEF04677.1 hypothetical protein DF17_22580 [Streptomyces rimosus]KEF19911.1 hypothetical protein DF18_13790 [Streptomyces rimosus]KOT31386.1 hypothetical protein ADK84_30195 [Streptomyces sp. NRRL WC-3701]
MRSPIAAVRSRARRRGKTPGQLRAECDDLVCTVVRLTAENDRLRYERARLEADFDRAAVDYSGALEDLRVAREEAVRLRTALAAWSEKKVTAS